MFTTRAFFANSGNIWARNLNQIRKHRSWEDRGFDPRLELTNFLSLPSFICSIYKSHVFQNFDEIPFSLFFPIFLIFPLFLSLFFPLFLIFSLFLIFPLFLILSPFPYSFPFSLFFPLLLILSPFPYSFLLFLILSPFPYSFLLFLLLFYFSLFFSPFPYSFPLFLILFPFPLFFPWSSLTEPSNAHLDLLSLPQPTYPRRDPGFPKLQLRTGVRLQNAKQEYI